MNDFCEQQLDRVETMNNEMVEATDSAEGDLDKYLFQTPIAMGKQLSVMEFDHEEDKGSHIGNNNNNHHQNDDKVEDESDHVEESKEYKEKTDMEHWGEGSISTVNTDCEHVDEVPWAPVDVWHKVLGPMTGGLESTFGWILSDSTEPLSKRGTALPLSSPLSSNKKGAMTQQQQQHPSQPRRDSRSLDRSITGVGSNATLSLLAAVDDSVVKVRSELARAELKRFRLFQAVLDVKVCIGQCHIVGSIVSTKKPMDV